NRAVREGDGIQPEVLMVELLIQVLAQTAQIERRNAVDLKGNEGAVHSCVLRDHDPCAIGNRGRRYTVAGVASTACHDGGGSHHSRQRTRETGTLLPCTSHQQAPPMQVCSNRRTSALPRRCVTRDSSGAKLLSDRSPPSPRPPSMPHERQPAWRSGHGKANTIHSPGRYCGR